MGTRRLRWWRLTGYNQLWWLMMMLYSATRTTRDGIRRHRAGFFFYTLYFLHTGIYGYTLNIQNNTQQNDGDEANRSRRLFGLCYFFINFSDLSDSDRGGTAVFIMTI